MPQAFLEYVKNKGRVRTKVLSKGGTCTFASWGVKVTLEKF